MNYGFLRNDHDHFAESLYLPGRVRNKAVMEMRNVGQYSQIF
jgi:hypothetical protein